MKCEKCGNETVFMYRCKDCNYCDDCNGKDNLVYYSEGLLCNNCHQKE